MLLIVQCVDRRSERKLESAGSSLRRLDNMRIRVTPEDRVLQWAATADVKDVERVLGSVRNILTARKPKRKRTLKEKPNGSATD
jgi:hypothetical protein